MIKTLIYFRFQISDFRFQISDFRFQISDFRFRISDFGFAQAKIADFSIYNLLYIGKCELRYRFNIRSFISDLFCLKNGSDLLKRYLNYYQCSTNAIFRIGKNKFI